MSGGAQSLMSASPDPSGHLQLGTHWCFVEFSMIQFVMKPSGLNDQRVFWGKKIYNFTFMTVHCAIYMIDFSSVHTRCPPELVSLIFFIFFF